MKNNFLKTNQTYIIAELSANHSNDIQIAKQSIKQAKKAGANAIKFQIYTQDTLTLDCNREDFIIKDTIWKDKKLYDLYKEASMPWHWYEQLVKYAKEIKIDIFASPFDKSSVDFLEQFNPIAYKIASFEITDYEFIDYVASKKRPMIISTGIATKEEIYEVLEICKKRGVVDIVLLQCTSSYPAPLEEANLKTITSFRDDFNVIAGFSDHTLGITAPIVAISLGARVIEKHFILDKSISSADSSFSLDFKEFEQMVQAVRQAELLIGKIDFSMSKNKEKNRQFARSLYICKDIKKGEKFSRDNIKSVRPGYGIHPKHLKDILGKEAMRDYCFGDRLEL